MLKQSNVKTAVVVLSWNGQNDTIACLTSLKKQTHKADIIVVENASTDGSAQFLKTYPGIVLLQQSSNLGFAGGVNVGITYAMSHEYEYVALLNNDALADPLWLAHLIHTLETNPNVGIAASRMTTADGAYIDSTGEMYTVWGLPYPRGRGLTPPNHASPNVKILGASGGASLYRLSMFKHVGLFDDRFFAYYEDVDISLRAQLFGWKIYYTPDAIALHKIGASSGKIKGFTTYQTMKNLPLLFIKNVPLRYLFTMGWRFLLAYNLLVLNAIIHRRGGAAVKGVAAAFALLPHGLRQRKKIQASRSASDQYFWSIITHDMPPQAYKLRKLRSFWWNLRGKS